MNSGICLTNISITLPNGRSLFHNFSVSLLSGKLYFLTGKNGAGKSTLFHALRGDLTKKDIQLSGKISFDATHEYRLDDQVYKNKIRKLVMILSQDYDEMLTPLFTVKENLQGAALTSSFPTLASMPLNIKYFDFLENVQITPELLVENLSGGQRQLVALIAAFQKPFQLLLLDEPTASLDEQNTQMVINFLADIVQKTGIVAIMICHDKEMLKMYDDQYIIKL